MGKIVKKLIDLVGNILLLELSNYNVSNGLKVCVVVKLEYFNLVGSVKDCIFLVMVEDVEVKGMLKFGVIIIELISGNIGVGLVFVVVVKGYKLILIMFDMMSMECRNLLKVLGVEFVFILGVNGMKGVIVKVEELRVVIFGFVIL